jgi:hypothetical protein
MPPSDLNLSVTRHASLSRDELWARGSAVANQRAQSLLGRADVTARNVRNAGLDAADYPLPDNPEHAHIMGWPHEKPAQKIAAQQLAAQAEHAATPDGG